MTWIRVRGLISKVARTFRFRHYWGYICLMFRNDASAYYKYRNTKKIQAQGGDDDPSNPLWFNFGYWENARTHHKACSALARKVADIANLANGDEVLDVGFGFGDQDFLWMKEYNPNKITALNITTEQIQVAKRRCRLLALEDQINFQYGSATDIPFSNESFDKVLALECAFHFKTRDDFFREAFRVLHAGGQLALTDMLPLENDPNQRNLFRTWFDARCSGMPLANYYDRTEYAKRLYQNGFTNVQVISIRRHVYPGIRKIYAVAGKLGKRHIDTEITINDNDPFIEEAFAHFSRKGLGDYVLVAAEKPVN